MSTRNRENEKPRTFISIPVTKLLLRSIKRKAHQQKKPYTVYARELLIQAVAEPTP